MSKKSRFKKWLRQQNEEEFKEEKKEIKKEETIHEVKHRNLLMNIYDKHYKKLLIVSFALLLFAIIVIGIKYAQTGEFFKKSVDIQGGISITLSSDSYIDISKLQNTLSSDFNQNDINIRTLSAAGKQTGIIVDIDIDLNDKENTEKLINAIRKELNLELKQGEYTIAGIGSSLGKSFFKGALLALLVAFIAMSIIVFLSFRVPVPSLAVVLAAFSDIITTLAVVDLIGMRISTAGIAAFLMLIGYSVDTDILLSTRVLKRKEGSVLDKTIDAAKTGLMMSLTAIAAVLIALIFTQSSVLKEIMIIIIIGLLADIIYTWIQNAGILRWYLQRKNV